MDSNSYFEVDISTFGQHFFLPRQFNRYFLPVIQFNRYFSILKQSQQFGSKLESNNDGGPSWMCQDDQNESPNSEDHGQPMVIQFHPWQGLTWTKTRPDFVFSICYPFG